MLRSFNWIEYFSRYPDLKQNGVCTELGAKVHWLTYGKEENRIPLSLTNDITIAVYSCNFGNYRNELNKFKLKLDPKIDYFLFTDKDFRLTGWNVIKTPLIPSSPHMDVNRMTTKHHKFILPKVLQRYDWVVWIDTSLSNWSVSYEKCIKLITQHPSIDAFHLTHNVRSTIQEELMITINTGVENREAGSIFLEKIKDFVSPYPLSSNGFFLRNTKSHTNDAFENCFRLLNQHGLKRDQNMYHYAIHETNMKPLMLTDLNHILFLYFDNHLIYKSSKGTSHVRIMNQ